MSSETPGPGAPGPEPTPTVDYLGAKPRSPRGGGRRWGIAAAATVGVLAVAGAGAFAFSSLAGGGPGTAEAVPEDALAYLALDLDPDAGQKLEAYQLLKKFPAIEEKLDGGEDLRRSIVEAILSEAPCDDLTFADDFDPWLGDRVAVSVVAGEDAPVPFLVVQVKDEEKARAGVEAVAECDSENPEEAGTAFVGDYMVVAEDARTAARIAEDAEAAPLAEADGFDRWVDEAGGAGIVTGYVSAAAPQAFLDAAEAEAVDIEEELGDPEQLSEMLEDFEGGAMVVRLDDGALEVEAAMSTMPSQVPGEGGDSGLVDLPASTVIALGFGVGDDAVQDFLDELAKSVGQEEFEAMVAELEADSGLRVPEDVQALLGDGVSVAVDSSIDMEGISAMGAGSLDVPVGIRITGDPDEIVPVLEKLVAMAGVEGQVVIEAGDGVVAVGVSDDYVTRLAEDGDLGEQDGFRKAMPDMDDSAGGLFVDFDSDDWLSRMLEGEPDAEEVRANLEPLDSLGITGSVDGDVTRGTLRLTTD